MNINIIDAEKEIQITRAEYEREYQEYLKVCMFMVDTPSFEAWLARRRERRRIDEDAADEILEIIKADRKRRGEPVAYRLLRKNADGDWVTDGRPWCDGIPDGDLVRDSAKSGQYRIEYAYAAPQPAEPDYKQLFEQMCERCDALDAKLAEYSEREPVAWHSKLYGTVWMAIKPGSLVPGTQWFIDGRTEPVAEVISPDSLVWRIPAGDLPHGTVFYSAPQPAEPVTHNDCDLSGQFERSDIENHRLRRAMQKIMARLTELLDEDQFATIEGIATDAGVEPPAEPVKDGTPLGKALDGINSYFASKKADEPVKAPSDDEIMSIAALQETHGDAWQDAEYRFTEADFLAAARALLARYGKGAP